MNSRFRETSTACFPTVLGSILALMISTAFAAPTPFALPTGGQVFAGNAVISQTGTRMTVDQSSAKAILNWNSFNIGSGASVNFNQPSASAVTLNRVLSSDPSAIYGQMSANGQVFLINPNGIVFGTGARVDVGGLVASTLSLSDTNFLDGNYRFSRDGATSGILNQGDIKARYAALLAPEIRNEGVITATMGKVALAGGEAVILNLTGQDLVDIQVEKSSIDTLVSNQRLIQADGGSVILSAQSAQGLIGQVVNTGRIEANGVSGDGGMIRLTASATIANSGTISANAADHGKGGTIVAIADLANPESRTEVDGTWSATGGHLSGDGGFIETSANRLAVRDSATISTLAPQGRAGQWLLDPNDFTIAAAGGDITGAALTAALAGGNVTITTTAGNANCAGVGGCTVGTAGTGDINVNTSVTIGAGNYLALSAYRNINFNSQIAVNSDPSTRLYLWYGMKGAGQPGAIVVNAGGGTTGEGNNIKGGNFNTEAAHTYPILGNLVYTPPNVDAYVRASSGTSVYGDTPGFSYGIYDTASGGSSLGISPSGSVAWNTPISATTSVGSYSLTYTGSFSLSGYSFHPGTAATWTITPRPVTATVSKTYDGNTTFNSGFVISNLVNNDTLSLSGRTTSANTGTYTSLSSLNLGNSNYSLNGITATIVPKPVTINVSKVYDGTPTFGSNFNLSGIIAGETVSVSGSTSTSSANVGSYSFSPSSLSLSSGNYSIGGFSASITPRTLLITAEDKGRVHGKANPSLTYIITGYVPGETAATVGLSGTPGLTTTAQVNSPPLVTYPITVDTAGLSLVSGNYVFGTQPGIFTIRSSLGDMWTYVVTNLDTVVRGTFNSALDSEADYMGTFVTALVTAIQTIYFDSGVTVVNNKIVGNFTTAMSSFVVAKNTAKSGDLETAKFRYATFFNEALKSFCPTCSDYSDAEYREWFDVTQ